MAEKPSRKPDASAFKQQTLKAWRPILTPRLVILLFCLIGLVFVPLGAVIIYFSNQVVEIEGDDYSATREDGSPNGCCISNCAATATWERVEQNPCNVTLVVDKDMEPPIYMYYKLTNYYQNHRRYVRSRDDGQLKGDVVPESELAKSDSCNYYFRKSDDPSLDNEPSNVISPCGLIAHSVFNDSFALFNSAGAPVPLNETGIAWESDLRYKFKNSANGSTGQNFPAFAHWRQKPCAELPTAEERAKCAPTEATAGWCYEGSGYCVEDEHFVVWMRAAGLPSFRKLYARINQRLPVGTYTVRVTNGIDGGNGAYVNAAMGGAPQQFLYPVKSFGGTKRVVLSTATWIGGKNLFLGYAYVVVGVICIVLALCFLIKYHLSPRALGNASYISWQKDGQPKQA